MGNNLQFEVCGTHLMRVDCGVTHGRMFQWYFKARNGSWKGSWVGLCMYNADKKEFDNDYVETEMLRDNSIIKFIETYERLNG